MFGSKDHLGFTEDDLDTSPTGDRRRRPGNDQLTTVRNALLIVNISLAIVLAPVVGVSLLSASQSTDPDRWTDFWIGTAVLLVLVLAIEVFFIMRLLRSSKDAPGIFTGDERA